MVSTDYEVTGKIILGGGNHSSSSFKLEDTVGSLIIGNASSTNFKLTHGLTGPASFTPQPTPTTGGAGVTGGGGTCGVGYEVKDGVCVPKAIEAKVEQGVEESLTGILKLGSKISPGHPAIGVTILLGVLVVIIFAFARLGDYAEEKIEEKKRRKQWEKTLEEES